MAVDSTPKLMVRMSGLAKIETTTGTAEALVADDGQFNLYNIKPSYNIPMEERPAQASMGILESVAGERFGAVEFDCDLCGLGSSGSAPPWATTFLPACGYTQSTGTFTAGYQASQPTITFGTYIDGVKFALAGAAGTLTLNLQSGKAAKGALHFRFVGKLVADADVALVTPTAFNTLPPRFAGNTVLIAGAYTPYLSRFSLELGNELQMRPFQGDATGGRACVITNRKPTVTLDPELELVATRDWYTKLITNATESIAVGVGTSANNIATINSTYVQWTEIPVGNRNGLANRDVKGQICRDSHSLVFS